MSYRKELVSGAINGANTVFATSVAYAPGSVRAFINGQLCMSQLTELGGTSIQLEFPPRAGDQIAAYYQETL